MGKYKDLVDGLMNKGRAVQANKDALVAANSRAFPFLVDGLGHHEDEVIREICAEILGERESTKAIPALIEALNDPCISVRQDAIWSIERICRYENGALLSWLDLDHEEVFGARDRVLEWWQANKKFLEGNEYL